MCIFKAYKSWAAAFAILVLIGCCTPNQIGLVAPQITSISPIGTSSTACPTATVVATFSEAITPSTVNSTTFTLTAAGNLAVAGQVSYSGNIATFSPTNKLSAGATYTATITTGVRDLYGNSMAANVVSNFTIAANGCNPAPVLASITPAASAIGVCPNAAVVATFSEPMNVATITAASFTLSPGTTGTVTHDATNSIFTLTPSTPLTISTQYTARISTAAQDNFGNSLANPVVSTFTTAANGCNPAPLLTSVTPPAGVTGICPNAAVVATFSEPMNVGSITAADFTLSPGVIGTVTHDSTNTVFTLTPSSALALNTQYTARITSAAQDNFGNALANPLVSTFTTAANGCNPPPTVLAIVPAAGATNVCPNKVISATFSEPMSPASLNAQTFSVSGPGGTPVGGVVTYDNGSNTVIFTPAAALALSTAYTVTVTTGAQDNFGNSLGSNYTKSFTTGANSCLPAAPPVTVTPAAGSTGVCQSTVVSATFAQAMNTATLNATTFTLTAAGGAQVTGAISHDAAGKIFTFTPGAALALGTTYTATISTGAQDLFGNPLATNFTWTFTTSVNGCGQTAAPTVVSVAPIANAVGVCTNAVLDATFSEAMDPTTINGTTFTLSPAAAGTVTLDSTGQVAAYTPTTNLALNTTYIATITTGAKDLFGNPLAAAFSWSFTTSTLTCQPPVPLGTAANFEILAGSTVTNTGPTIVSGSNLGLSPGNSVTGFAPGILITPAVMDITDPVAAQAQLDLTIAYNYAAGLAGGAALPADMTGKTFTPGLYNNATSVTLSSGNVTLDAQGNANAIFIFQVGSTLITLGNTQVILKGGAQAKNIFWQVGSSATLGVASTFEGTILALQSITLDTGASLQGRALARNGAVTLDSNPVTAP